MRIYKIIFPVSALAFLLLSSIYIVDQRQTALVLQFGEPMRQELEPGLKFKLPFIQDVVFFEKRIQHLNFSPGSGNELVAIDQKTMMLDAFAKYKIVNPLQFYQTVQSDARFKLRIGSIIESSIRSSVGRMLFVDILDQQRTALVANVTAEVNKKAEEFGVKVLDVRLVRINLPDATKDAVYSRMKADRVKEAKELRAQGIEQAQIIRANTDKEKTILLANAKRESEILKGMGDAQAIQIFSDVANQDPEFFRFYKSMEAYNNIFSSAKSQDMVLLSSDNSFMKYFFNISAQDKK